MGARTTQLGLIVIGATMLIHFHAPTIVREFVKSKVSGGTPDYGPHPSVGQFGGWLGAYALLSAIMLGAAETNYADAASALTSLLAVGVVIMARQDIADTFHLNPSPPAAAAASSAQPQTAPGRSALQVGQGIQGFLSTTPYPSQTALY